MQISGMLYDKQYTNWAPTLSTLPSLHIYSPWSSRHALSLLYLSQRVAAGAVGNVQQNIGLPASPQHDGRPYFLRLSLPGQ